MSSSAGESDRESSLEESESLATERVSNSQEENQNGQNYAQVSKIFYSLSFQSLAPWLTDCSECVCPALIDRALKDAKCVKNL